MGTQHTIRLFITAEHPCGYYSDRMARDLIIDPSDPELPRAYPNALNKGFRRSGGHVYRPHCIGCNACVPVRIDVNKFMPNRNQKRCLKRNADLHVRFAEARQDSEVFGLYQRYLDSRHKHGGMDDPTPESFSDFLLSPWNATAFLEFRLQEQLVAVAVTDVSGAAFSSVYTFFEPGLAQRSLGTFAVLQQIATAREHHRRYVYLGFWLDSHPKMDYKKQFAGLERLHNGEWIAFEDQE
jgi:leucyl-tRNA---protein transferase